VQRRQIALEIRHRDNCLDGHISSPFAIPPTNGTVNVQRGDMATDNEWGRDLQELEEVGHLSLLERQR
jgi:hypothetical protein